MVSQRPGRTCLPTGASWLGLLAPEDVVVWKNPKSLIADLRRGLASDDLGQAFVAANRLALELYRVRELTAAEEVCRREIAFARSRDPLIADTPVLLLGLQAAINLIRINGYAGQSDLAFAGLAQLEELADGRPAELFGLSIGPGVLQGSSRRAHQLRSFARNNCIVETSKILYRRGTADLCVAQCGRLYAKWPSMAQRGPFHACEVLCLHASPGVPAPDQAGPVAPPLASIARLHRLAACAPGAGRPGVGDPATRAAGLQLFGERADNGLGDGLAQARYLAVLADTLHRCAEPAAADVCFETACRIAGRLDPGLTEKVSRRRASYGHADVLANPRCLPVEPEELLSLLDLLAVTFEVRHARGQQRATAARLGE